MNRSDINISMITLGCSKNLVDAECMIKLLKNLGYSVVDDISIADVAVINTCGFIESAKSEAISVILDTADYKSGRLKHIIVSGCLPQRYSGDILKEMPEVDIVLGTSHYKDIGEAVDSLFSEQFKNEYVSEAGGIDHLMPNREVSTKSYAWLKIGEGCRNRCSFCAIPIIRGNYISRTMEDILEEARILANDGYKEIILAAQDTTNYGIDIYSKRSLPLLLRELSNIEGIELIRVMYGYMDGFDDDLISEIANNPKIANYLDVPIQYGENSILKSMNRRDTVEVITDRLNRLRSLIPNLIIRTTVMVGFPGETEEKFIEFKENLKKWKFDRLGCFVFSPEEGTVAYDMPSQVDEETKERRYKEVYELQNTISIEKNKLRLGEETIVTIDSVADDGIFYVGRSYGEAPEVDPVIFVASSKEEELIVGNRYKIKIVDCSDYELTGVTI